MRLYHLKRYNNILNINNAQHPSRQKAIYILNAIEEKCNVDLCGLTWYELEDMITHIIEDYYIKQKRGQNGRT